MRICIYAASSAHCDAQYREDARLLGETLARAGHTLVYGGGAVGSMGALADGALGAGGEVIGIIPRFMVELEWAHQHLSALKLVEDMRERKHQLLTGSDAVIALPGGCGTLEELFEAITLKRLGIYHKPIVLLNTRDYWTPWADFMQRQVIDYVQKYYLPLSERGQRVQADGAALARTLGDWKAWIRQQWPFVSLQASAHLPASVNPGEHVTVSAQVNAAGIAEHDLHVEAVLRRGEHIIRVPLEHRGQGRYETSVPLTDSGLYSFGVRMMPAHAALSSEFELGLLRWA